MNNTKIVYIISNLGIGGVEVALLSAIRTLNREFDFRLICLNPFNTDFIAGLSDEERKNIITYKVFPFNYLRTLYYILKFKPNVVITSLWKAAPIGVLVKLFRPLTKYVEFIHSSIFFHSFDKLFTKLALKSADVVFCDSASAKNFIEKQGFRKSIQIISFLRFRQSEPWVPKSQIVLKALFVGRLNKCKRIDRLILLVKELANVGLPFQVDVYGPDDGAMDSAKILIKENRLETSVFLKGEIAADKIRGLFSKYDFYFQTSEVEGMAMSVVEAMQHGLICVVTNVGEICNYAKNGCNTIVIDKSFNLRTSVEQVKNICNNIDAANVISKNAFLTFYDKKDFADSLVETLKKCV